MHELYTSKWTALGASALTVIGLTLNTLAFAQPRLAHPPDADKAACFSQMDQVDLNSCIAELRNARADIQKGRTPDVPPEALAANRLKRCDVHPTTDRLDCEARVLGKGTQTGSVEGGGTLTEYVRTVPAP